MKIPMLILSFHEPDSSGGFNWALDTPENREWMLDNAKTDAEDYRDVILIAASVEVEDDAMPNDITEMLDAELVFECGRVGKILHRSEGWKDSE